MRYFTAKIDDGLLPFTKLQLSPVVKAWKYHVALEKDVLITAAQSSQSFAVGGRAAEEIER